MLLAVQVLLGACKARVLHATDVTALFLYVFFPLPVLCTYKMPAPFFQLLEMLVTHSAGPTLHWMPFKLQGLGTLRHLGVVDTCYWNVALGYVHRLGITRSPRTLVLVGLTRERNQLPWYRVGPVEGGKGVKLRKR